MPLTGLGWVGIREAFQVQGDVPIFPEALMEPLGVVDLEERFFSVGVVDVHVLKDFPVDVHEGGDAQVGAIRLGDLFKFLSIVLVKNEEVRGVVSNDGGEGLVILGGKEEGNSLVAPHGG